MYQKVHMPSTRPQRLVAVVEKTQAMSGKMDMETRVMQVISISAKDHREASTANIKYTLSA